MSSGTDPRFPYGSPGDLTSHCPVGSWWIWTPAWVCVQLCKPLRPLVVRSPSPSLALSGALQFKQDEAVGRLGK